MRSDPGFFRVLAIVVATARYWAEQTFLEYSDLSLHLANLTHGYILYELQSYNASLSKC